MLFYRYAVSRVLPPADSEDNLIRRNAQVSDGVTSIYFRRKLDTGDLDEDISLDGVCLFVLWAWGSTITRTGSVSQHTSRGIHGTVCFPSANNDCPGELII